MSIGIKIIAVLGGFLAFFVACTGISFSIDTTTEFLESNDLTDEIVEPIKPTLDSWSNKFQVFAWTGLVAFVSLLIPSLPYKFPILLLEVLSGAIISFLV